VLSCYNSLSLDPCSFANHGFLVLSKQTSLFAHGGFLLWLDSGGRAAFLGPGLLLRLDEAAEDANLLIFVLLEVKPVLLAKSELEQVIIKRLFGNVNFLCGIFQRVSNEVPITQNPIVQLAPQADLLNNLVNRPLLSTLAVMAFVNALIKYN